MKSIKTFVVENDTLILNKLENLLFNHKDFQIVGLIKDRDKDKILDNLIKTKPELLILSKEIAFSEYKKQKFCSIIDKEMPEIIIIIVAPFEEHNDLRESMKLGAKDFIVEHNIDKMLIPTAIELVEKNRNYSSLIEQKSVKTISFNSIKGGTGKTVLSLNVAVEMANMLSQKDKKVLYVDLDSTFGDVSYVLGNNNYKNLLDLYLSDNVDEDKFLSFLIKKTNNLYILPTNIKPILYIKISIDKLHRIIELAKNNFDYIIFDSIPFQSMSDITLFTSFCVDLPIFVIENSLLSYKNLKSFTDILNELLSDDDFKSSLFINDLNFLTYREKLKLIVNKYDYKKESISYDNVLYNKFSIKNLGNIPNNPDMFNNNINKNEIIVEKYPNSDVAKNIRNITKNILYLFEEETDTTIKTQSSKKGLFSKLFD